MTQIICPKCKEEFDDLEVDDFADIDCILQIGECWNCGKKRGYYDYLKEEFRDDIKKELTNLNK